MGALVGRIRYFGDCGNSRTRRRAHRRVRRRFSDGRRGERHDRCVAFLPSSPQRGDDRCGRSSRTSGAGSCFGGEHPALHHPAATAAHLVGGGRLRLSGCGSRFVFLHARRTTAAAPRRRKGGQRFSFRLRQRKPARNSSTPRCRNPAMDSDGALVGALHCEMGKRRRGIQGKFCSTPTARCRPTLCSARGGAHGRRRGGTTRAVVEATRRMAVDGGGTMECKKQILRNARSAISQRRTNRPLPTTRRLDFGGNGTHFVVALAMGLCDGCDALGAASAWRERTRGEENDGAASPFAALPRSEVDCHVAALTPRSVQLGTTERPDQPGHGGRRGLLHAARWGAGHSFEETANRNGGGVQ